MAKEFFGTDGIRGVPGTSPLDDKTLFAVGRSVGSYLLQRTWLGARTDRHGHAGVGSAHRGIAGGGIIERRRDVRRLLAC